MLGLVSKQCFVASSSNVATFAFHFHFLFHFAFCAELSCLLHVFISSYKRFTFRLQLLDIVCSSLGSSALLELGNFSNFSKKLRYHLPSILFECEKTDKTANNRLRHSNYFCYFPIHCSFGKFIFAIAKLNGRKGRLVGCMPMEAIKLLTKNLKIDIRLHGIFHYRETLHFSLRFEWMKGKKTPKWLLFI